MWVCLFPEIGSFVVVGFVADGAAGVVLLTEKIESAEIVIGDTSAVISADGVCASTWAAFPLTLDKNAVTFNGGDLGGLVKAEALTDKLNELTQTVNALITSYNAHTHITTATVGATTAPGLYPRQLSRRNRRSHSAALTTRMKK